MRLGPAGMRDSKTMALAGAVMFASGGILTLLAMRLPHPAGMASDTQLVTSSIVIVAGAVLLLVPFVPAAGAADPSLERDGR
jgi:hypothetical protein